VILTYSKTLYKYSDKMIVKRGCKRSLASRSWLVNLSHVHYNGIIAYTDMRASARLSHSGQYGLVYLYHIRNM